MSLLRALCAAASRVIVICIPFLASSLSFGGTFTAYGSQTYVRATGDPVTVTNTFSVLNPNTQYTLRVHNGGLTDSPTDLVSSTTITVNGVLIIAPSDLNQTITEVDKPVTLQASNQIAVQVRGAPGGALAVDIIGVDNDPPTITASASPGANAAGWNNSNVTVTFACSDATSGIATCPPPVTISVEGASQLITGQAVDKAGNTATASITLNIDKTPPLISAASAPLANAAGWNNSDVTVTFTCSDSTSGISVCPAPVRVSTDGQNQVITGQATDIAGNIVTTSAHVNLDKTPPTITAIVNPPPNAAGWNNSNVTVSFACSDSTSGIANCPPPHIISSEGVNQVVSGSATDIAGNIASAAATIKLDKTPPIVTIASPPNGSTISLSTISIGLNGSQSDSLSGVSGVTCNGTPAAIVGSTFSCTVLLTQGANSISVQATDSAGNSSASPLSLTYVPAPQLAIRAPANLSITNLSPATVIGTVNDPTAIVTVNGILAPQSGGTFAIPVPLVEGLNVLTAVATNASGVASTASVQVTLDTTPPHLTIDSPADGSATTDASVTVSGLANDVVVGTVNAQDVQVTVNGIPAQVANRTFAAPAVPLGLGVNTIQATGRDHAGNSTSISVSVTRVQPSQPPAPPIGAAIITQSLTILGGNNQTGTVGQPVASPLVVALTDQANHPLVNQPVVFKVTGNNGTVSAPGSGTPSSAIAVNTDASGQAQVTWTLGDRAGTGINTVQVSSTLAIGAANFAATGVNAPAFQIVVDSGNDQTGVVGQPLGFPFVADVVDGGHNRVPNVPVTFTIRKGDGTLGGLITQTVNTDSNGRAITVLTLGTQIGNANNVVEATFPNNPGFPAAFAASARAPGNPANTTISGVVLDNSNNPIQGVTIRLFATNQGNNNNLPVQVGNPVQTDAKGTFLIQPAPIGFFKLMADGTTAASPKSYPPLEYDIVTVAGNDNTVGMPIYLPALDTVNRICVDETHGGTLTLPQVPGFSLTVAAGAATFPGGARQGCVTVTPVNGDKVPMSPGFGQQPRFIVTIQPVGTKFDPPAAITLPNVDGLPPKAVTEMYSYDHDLGMFVAIGTGTVSADGSVIVSNPGVGVLKAGWHCGGNPNSTGSAGTCPQCQVCQGSQCVAGPAGGTCTLSDPCMANPTCDGAGSCTGKPKQITAVTVTASDADVPSNSGNPLIKVAADDEATYPVIFQATATTQDCPDLDYDWDYGDGSPLDMNAGDSPSHDYANAGIYTVTVTAHCGTCRTARMSTTMQVVIAKAENVDITVHPSVNVHGGANFPDIDFDTSGNNADATHNVDPHLLPMAVNTMDLECLTTPGTDDPNFGAQIAALIQWNIKNDSGTGTPPTLTPNGKFATLASDQKGKWAASCYLDANQNQQLESGDSDSNPFNVVFVATVITQIQSNANQFVAQSPCQGAVCVSSAGPGGGFDPTNIASAAFWGQLKITVDDGGAGAVTVPNFNYTFVSNMAADTFTATYQNGRTIKEVFVNPPANFPQQLICAGNVVFQPFPILDDGGNTVNGFAQGGDSVTNTGQQDENDISATQRVLTYVDSPGVAAQNPDPCVNPNPPQMTATAGFNRFSFYLLAYSDEFDTAYAALAQVNPRVTFSGTVNAGVWASNGANSTIISRFTGAPFPEDAGAAGIDVYGPSDVGNGSNLRLDGRN